MELEVTWGRAVRIWWAYLWRNIIAVLVAMIIGGIMGGIIGAVMALSGLPREAIAYVTMPIGFLLGMGISVVPIKLILGKDFGEFRLLLVSKEQQPDR
jgi:hypothetical protein